MKRVSIISILIIAIGLKTEAQNQTYTQVFDSLFSNVPYSTVATGILHDRVANIQLNFISLQKIKYLTPKIELS